MVPGGCASAPSGHYRFALAANDARTPDTWSLTPLPHYGCISLAAHTGEETDPQQSTHLMRRLLPWRGRIVGPHAVLAMFYSRIQVFTTASMAASKT